MTHEKIASLIQVNMENFWKKMADTKCVDIYESDVAVYMNAKKADPIFNSIIRFAPNEHNLDAEMDKLHAYYTSKNLPYCWWTAMLSNATSNNPTSNKPTSNKPASNKAASNSSSPSNVVLNNVALANNVATALSNRLIAEGFTQTLDVAGMAMNIESFQWDGFLPEHIEIVPITDPKQLFDWMEPIKASFDMIPEVRTLYINIMTEWLKQSDDLLSYIMYANGQPVSTFSVFFDKEVASFYNVATLPAFRNQRISSSIAACCLEMAKQKKYQWVTLQASPYSKSLFERLGFRTYINYVLRFK